MFFVLSYDVAMAKCSYCGKETILHDRGTPLCVECSDLLDAGKKPVKRETEPEPESKDTIKTA